MKKRKPTTPSQRHTTTVTYRGVLTATEPYKALTKGRKNTSGRNSAGRITTRHKGGGNKRTYRDIDFRYDKHDIPAKVETIEYDPYRSGFIALVLYADGARRYILAPQSLQVGDSVVTGADVDIKPGNRTTLSRIPVGTFIYNIEIKPNAGARLARSAGVYAEVVAQGGGYTQIKMPSSEVRKIIDSAWASVGSVSNEEYKLRNLGKAGRSRWLGVRPTVRGSAMNPVDHPYGGGEGRSPRGRRRAVSKWGKPTGKGQKTRRSKKYSDKFIVERRKVGKKRR